MSINEIAKQCKISPNGAYKILAKLELEGILKAKQISNIKAYYINFDNEKTSRVLEIAFIFEIKDGRIKARADDLKPFMRITRACVIFGSYISAKQKPGDLDIFFILEKRMFESYKKALAKAQDIVPLKIHDIVQTPADAQKNLKKHEPIVTEALRNGIVLWGAETIVRAIKNGHK